jgi:xanthine/CO dehydrogenase XdhC/CoxF family maturation factor
MTKEINDIINAFHTAQLHSRKTALATVVHVEGSSYRRPGARMLVEDNGKLTGAISGGCLEGDALKKALLAIEQQHNKLVTYNTNYEDDAEFGIQLGCNGIVHILFEPIDPSQPNHPIAILEKCAAQRKDVVLSTLFSLKNYYGEQPGTCFFFNGENIVSTLTTPGIRTTLIKEASLALANKASHLKENDEGITAFVEFIQPPVSLVVVGAGNDALPLVEMANILGWQIIVTDGRSSHASKQRFPTAHQIIVGKPYEIVNQLVIDERSVFVLMTHNYNYDLEMLRVLLRDRTSYVGILGPKKKLERMLDALYDEGIVVTPEQLDKIFGPTGLDIGAETAEEIALSILAEIKAVMEHREGNSLRDRMNEIHSRSEIVISENNTIARQQF